jgi:hypothetical protein
VKATRLSIALLVIAVVCAPAQQQQRYTLQDLQVLDRQKAWDELFMHLKDVPPSQRGPKWNQIVADVCLRPYENSDWWESWKIDQCSETLQAAMNSEPADEALAWKAAKWSVSVHAWSNAVPFFARVVQKPGDAHCQDSDLIGAVGAGLALSRGDKTAVQNN